MPEVEHSVDKDRWKVCNAAIEEAIAMSSLPIDIDPSERFENLPKSPIVEAVIHWRAPWGKAVEPDELLKRLQEKLSDYPHSQRQQQVGLDAEISPEKSAIHQRHAWHGFRFESQDRSNIAQFTRNGFVFSRLKPYQDWERFQQEAKRLWRIYGEITEPSEVSRLGVRFINQVMLNNLDDLGSLLTLPPQSPTEFPLPISGFVHQDTFDIPGRPYKLNAIQTVQPPNPPNTESHAFILDLDVFTTRAIQRDEVDEKLLHMHWIKNKAFFSLLTDTAMRRFKE